MVAYAELAGLPNADAEHLRDEFAAHFPGAALQALPTSAPMRSSYPAKQCVWNRTMP